MECCSALIVAQRDIAWRGKRHHRFGSLGQKLFPGRPEGTALQIRCRRTGPAKQSTGPPLAPVMVAAGVYLQVLGQVVCVQAIRRAQRLQVCQTGSSRNAGEDSGVLSDRVALIVGEEEELVVEDRSANLSTVAIVVEARVDGRLAALSSALGVQVAVLEVLIDAAVELIGSRDDFGVELAA